MNYVYVPWPDESMDHFAEQLVHQKNMTKFGPIGKHKLMERSVASGNDTPLATVGWHDALYVCLHGRGAGGEGAYHDRNGVVVGVTGQMLGEELRRRGLRNTSVDLRLWTCNGGVAAGQGGSFVQRLQDHFRNQGHASIKVSGYDGVVSVSTLKLREMGGQKTMGDGAPAKEHRVSAR